jgi:hypothetical protein
MEKQHTSPYKEGRWNLSHEKVEGSALPPPPFISWGTGEYSSPEPKNVKACFQELEVHITLEIIKLK